MTLYSTVATMALDRTVTTMALDHTVATMTLDHNVAFDTTVAFCCKIFSGDQLALKMETELVFETLAFDSTLTRLIARKNCKTFMRRETIKSYCCICYTFGCPTTSYFVMWRKEKLCNFVYSNEYTLPILCKYMDTVNLCDE
jgi:hypothetical protein